ncbi:MAG: class I SAM-dependent methyltransferase [Actinobacteria bacterium]|nr:class I SAM-dependent methyltransferase [Actinomycetota bacterium]
MSADAVVWHDLECGAYDADLPLWLELAAAAPGPVLDIGAGTGRVALPLARAGHEVHALDADSVLLDALRARAGDLPVTTVHADACAFSLPPRFGLCIVPMQTIHLLVDRPGFLRCAHAALRPGGVLAVALLGEGAEPFEHELEPERAELGGVLYASRPTALRLEGAAMVLERRRERTDADGTRAEANTVRLAAFGPGDLADLADAARFAALGTRVVVPTEDRVGSLVLVLRALSTPRRARSAAGAEERARTPSAALPAGGTGERAQATARPRAPAASAPEKPR